MDAVKERVDVPWRQSSSHLSKIAANEQLPEAEKDAGAFVSLPAADNSAASDTPPAISALDIAHETTKHSAAEPVGDTSTSYSRTISWHNFEKALKEITPSASESLGSLADLRKWNEEFGEGRKQRKQIVWGKGRFGFTIEPVEDRGVGGVDPAPKLDAASDRTLD